MPTSILLGSHRIMIPLPCTGLTITQRTTSRTARRAPTRIATCSPTLSTPTSPPRHERRLLLSLLHVSLGFYFILVWFISLFLAFTRASPHGYPWTPTFNRLSSISIIISLLPSILSLYLQPPSTPFYDHEVGMYTSAHLFFSLLGLA